MQVHDVQRKTLRKTARQVGRGGKRGKTSGKGHKGQKARAGRKLRPEMRDIIKKFPKKRGYKFASIKEKPFAVNVSELDKHFSAGETVTPQVLFAKGVVGRKGKWGVKILGSGSLGKALNISGLQVSASAKEKIEKAGGKVE